MNNCFIQHNMQTRNLHLNHAYTFINLVYALRSELMQKTQRLSYYLFCLLLVVSRCGNKSSLYRSISNINLAEDLFLESKVGLAWMNDKGTGRICPRVIPGFMEFPDSSK